jgi:hypothetical protein
MKLETTQTATVQVSEMILGQNIEICLTTADGLLSDRLRNPKFLGPAHPVTGVAPHWQGASCGRAAYDLVRGAGMMGSDAQLVRAVINGTAPHLHQNKVSVRAGEELECEIWARAWHKPVKITVSLRPLSSRSAIYDSAEVEIGTSYFERYSVTLRAGADDDEARLHIAVADGGELWFDQIHLRPKNEPHLSQGVIDTMADMRIPTLRFPGGIVVNAYNWRHGTGPSHLRPLGYDPAFYQDWYLNYDFGLDEYLQLALEQNITPTLTVNVATGTPQEAAEMAAYCAAWYAKAKAAPPKIFWHIANHPYSITTAHMTPDMYAGVVQTYVPLIKAAYPNSRIVAVMSSGELDAPVEKAAWREALFTQAADLIDVVAVQIYGSGDPAASAEKQLESLRNSLASVEPRLKAFIATCRQRGARWNVGIAEWNFWMQASHWDGRQFEEQPSTLHCLYIAGMIRRFARLAPDFECACFYNLVNCMGILNRRNADVDVTAAVEVFKLYRPALPGSLTPIKTPDDSPVEALALDNAEGRWLFLSNHNATEPITVNISGIMAPGAACEAMAGEVPYGDFQKIAAPAVGDSIELPPLSLIRLHGRKA